MRRIIVLIGIACLLIGGRMSDRGLLNLQYETLTVFDTSEDGRHVDEPIFAPTGYYRVDLWGGQKEVEDILNELAAYVVAIEQVSELTVIYARSPLLHGEGKFNVMIAYADNRITVGTPIIKGSY